MAGLRSNSAALFVIALLVTSLAQTAQAFKDFTMPAAKTAKSYPSHDDHPNEHVAVGIDPYNSADQANIFSLHFNDEGFLPVFVIVTNDGDQPVSLAAMKAELVTANHSKIPPATVDDVNRRLAHPSGSTTRSAPIPLPKKTKGGLSAKSIEEIQNAQFAAKAVEPHTTQAGFLFFDVSGIANPVSGSNLYLTGVQDAKGVELMFFEVPLVPSSGGHVQ